MISRRLALGALIALSVACAGLAADRPAPSLAALVDGPQRSAANKARDPWRHPLASLTFWGLRPDETVVEIDPGGGYWTEIVAPYLAAGGGRYFAGMADPASSDGARKGHDAFAARFADAATFGAINYASFSSAAGLVAPANSVDLIMISRNIHNLMWVPGGLDRALGSFYAALKPGGVLAVEEHRADPRPMIADARDGYVSEASVIAAAEKAGFVLAARSEINANPKDTKDHPFGVWTLPPTRRSAPEGQPADPTFDHTKYDAIGESDRMTLRFEKPAAR
jgi:predicted methyltransferase